MTAMLNCPLNADLFLQQSARPMGLGHLQAIENHVSSVNNCPHPPLNEFIFDGLVKGTTPLLLACHCGEFDSVKHIVESWEADVRDAATYYLHLTLSPLAPHAGLLVKIEGATPLFVAAFQGHSKIVQYLLDRGADVTAKTSDEAKPQYDGLTPLDGAVSGHWIGWNGWIHPHRRDLLDEQRAERHVIVLSLLEFGADLSASRIPLWTSRWCGVDTTMTLINHGMDLKQRNQGETENTVLHHWASTPYDFTEKDSLTIIKLLIEKDADVMAKDNYGFTPIMKSAETFRSGCYRKNLGQNSLDTVEWTTSDQLERLIQHPTEFEIKIQSILVQLRILSSRSWYAVFYSFLEYFCLSIDDSSKLEDMARDMMYEGKYLELLHIHWAILDAILLFEPSDTRLLDTSVSVVSSLIFTLLNCKSSNPTLLNIEIIKKSIHLILATDRLRIYDGIDGGTHPAWMAYIENRYSTEMFSFLQMLLSLPEMLDDTWGSLLQPFRHLGSDQLGSLLLMACEDYQNAHYFATIRLLLQLGAHVDTADEDGNRPLHLVAQADNEQSEAAGCLLLGYGAQIFRTNNSGKTAVDLWIERNEMDEDQEGEEGAEELRGRPDWCRTVRKLKCLTASCIRVNQVPYENEPEFFKDSHSFIKKH